MKAYVVESQPGWYVKSGKDDTSDINEAKTFPDKIRAKTFINHNMSGMESKIIPVEVHEGTARTVTIIEENNHG